MQVFESLFDGVSSFEVAFLLAAHSVEHEIDDYSIQCAYIGVEDAE